MGEHLASSSLDRPHKNSCMTRFATYKLVFGPDCVLPIELKAASWAIIGWEKVRILEDLLTTPARQLERNEDHIRPA